MKTNQTNEVTFTYSTSTRLNADGFHTHCLVVNVPAWDMTFKTSSGGWGYNHEASMLIDIMRQICCPTDGLHGHRADMEGQICQHIEDNEDPTLLETIPVIYRWDKRNGGFLTAILPTLPANPGNVMSYAHVGQHSEASLEWYSGTVAVPAEHQEEARALHKELMAIYAPEYALVIKAKLTRAMTTQAWHGGKAAVGVAG